MCLFKIKGGTNWKLPECLLTHIYCLHSTLIRRPACRKGPLCIPGLSCMMGPSFIAGSPFRTHHSFWPTTQSGSTTCSPYIMGPLFIFCGLPFISDAGSTIYPCPTCTLGLPYISAPTMYLWSTIHVGCPPYP